MEMPTEVWMHEAGYVCTSNLGGDCTRYIPASLLDEAVELLKGVQGEFNGSCTHCAYWNWQPEGVMTRISSFLERVRK